MTTSRRSSAPPPARCLYRRAMLEEVRLPSGILDRNYFMYFEDLDLGWRCRLAGWDAFYVPTAVVYHTVHASSKRHGAKFVQRHCKRNRIRTLLKNGSVPFLVRSFPKTILDVGALVMWDGLGALLEIVNAVQDSVPQRVAVARCRSARAARSRAAGSPRAATDPIHVRRPSGRPRICRGSRPRASGRRASRMASRPRSTRA